MESLYLPLTSILEFIYQQKSTYKIKIRHVVNFQKGTTGLIIFALMSYFSNFNPGCWLYLTLHGSYGLVWLMKDVVFTPKHCDEPITIFSFLSLCTLLLLYWIPAYLITSGSGVQFPSPQRIFVCGFLNILGTALMMAADTQKHYTLKYKQGLINDGMFKYTRSPNYLGEFMIYFSFAVCVGMSECYLLICGLFVTIVFAFVVVKEKSNKKKKGWDVYEKHSFVFLPKILPSSSFLSSLIYLGITFGIFSLIKEE